MRKICRMACVLTVVAVMCLLLAGQSLAASDSIALGNSDINILNGGVILGNAADFYYSENGAIYRENGGAATVLYSGTAKNLNYSGGYIYFTSGERFMRVPASGGAAEIVFRHGDYIKQLYIIDDAVARFVAGGYVYERPLGAGETTRQIAGDGDVFGLIPTACGDIVLTGGLFNYTVVVGGEAVMSGVTGCYTDSGYLAVNRHGQNYMVELERLLHGFDEAGDLVPFDIHGTVPAVRLFGAADEVHTCDVCEANAQLSVRLFSEEDGEEPEGESETESEAEEPDETFTPPEVSQGQRNIVLRARQQSEIKWTPLEDRYQWGYRGVFTAGETYTGLPYGQPVNTGYVPWTISYQGYLNAVNNNTSAFYTKYSEYNRIAPTYSCDCSSYVSAAWGLDKRLTTYSIPSVAQRVSDQSIYGMQVGDCLNESVQHVVLISDVRYNAEGEIVGIDIMEQTPVITRKTSYGEGGSAPLSRIQSGYFASGYVLYRNPNRDSVVYTHDCAVPLDGIYCPDCKTIQPRVKTSAAVGSRTVTLSHENANAAIYYTTDGSVPTANSIPYTGPITLTSTTPVRAIAVTTEFTGSTILEYTVKVPPVSKPTGSVATGLGSGNIVSAGTTIELRTETAGATLYYTTDGSEPTSASAKYTSPITVNADMVIKCIGEAVGMTRSETMALEYKIGAVYKIEVKAEKGGSISPTGTVSVLETTSSAFKITASAGYKIEDVVIDGTSHGAIAEYTFSNIAGGHTITAYFKEINVLPFTDILETDWFFSAVNTAFRQGLFNGTSTTEFSPSGSMTRGMFATVLGRLAGVPAVEGNVGIVLGDGVNVRSKPTTDSEILTVCAQYACVTVLSESDGWHKIQTGSVVGYIRNDLIKSGPVYSDVPEGMYYSSYVSWAGLTGIANSAGGTFDPDRNITREEMSVMLCNYAKQYGISLKKTRGAEPFTDEYLMSGTGRAAITELYECGVLNGMGDGTFEPQANSSRAQVAQIFTSYLTAISK